MGKMYWNPSKYTAMKKELEKTIQKLRNEVIIVEGKRDKEALESLGAKTIIPVAGRKNIRELEGIKNAVILTDLDRKGNLLAKKLEEELWSMGIKVDISTRKKLGKILKIKYFEELNKKYEEFNEGE